MKKICFLLVFLTGLKTLACINEYSEEGRPVGTLERWTGIPPTLDLDVLLAKADDLNPYLVTGFDKAFLELRKYSLEEKIKTDSNFRLLSNLAVVDLKLGNTSKALKTLELLYQEHPREYNITGNLGTAYELSGNIEKAIELMEKAIELNPHSHYGSEWIHLKILKEKARPSPQYKNVMQLENDNFARWLVAGSPSKDKLKELKKQLFFQLKERISFVPAPDPAVGQLLADLADIEQKVGDKDVAKQYYDKALEYDPSLAPVIKNHQDPGGVQLFYYRNKTLLISMTILILLFVSYLIIRRRKQIKAA
jgi:tetratricopeptide (TPR) repeat protein